MKRIALLAFLAAACATQRPPLVPAEPAVSNAAVAFTVATSRDLVPEGIAYDAQNDAFFLSSIHLRKIVQADHAGVRDFTTEGQDGMYASLGLKIDAKRRQLWAASYAAEEMRGYTAEDAGKSALFAYSLDDGSLLRKIVTGSTDDKSLLNDMAIADDGTLFITDSSRGVVFRLLPQVDKLEKYLDGFHYPNGIALSDDQRELFVADWTGITRVDLSDPAHPIAHGKLDIGGVDGLSFYNGDLIGIQNGTAAPRVIRIHPGDGSVEVLESKNALFDMPTTGVVAKDGYYFVANSHLRAAEPQRKDAVLLRIPLK